MFIQTELTPNPQTIKFIPGHPVVEDNTVNISSIEEAKISPLAIKLFNIDGITNVFLGKEFISVTQSSQKWEHIKPIILNIIMEHYLKNQPIIDNNYIDKQEQIKEFYDPKDQEIVNDIKELIETKVKPAVANDGGDVIFKGFKNGIVYLSLQGACSGCPASSATLKYGIQRLLQYFIPSVKSVEQQ